MSFEATIRTALLADAALVALIGDRVRPIHLAQGERRPHICYSIGDDDDPLPSHSGPSSWTRTTYDLVIVADSFATCRQISELVRNVMKNHSGTANDTYVHWTRYQSQTDVEQSPLPGQEKPLYARSQTYRAMHRAA